MTLPAACLMWAPAKVNLYLEVGRRREDGFHEIDTLFQAISLWDHVQVQRVGREVALTVHGADLGPTQENLAVRAARLFLSEIDSAEGVRIELTKEIPAGAGLGGGSSDAAAVLRAMNHLWDGPVPAGRLIAMGASLGADVAFFLGESPLARGTGRGEILEPLPPLPPGDLVVVLPPVHVATGAAYVGLARDGAGPGAGVRGESASKPVSRWTEVEALAHNDFQDSVAGNFPAVARSLETLRTAGGRPTLLSGSGGACFGLFPDQSAARTAADRLWADLGWPARAVRTLTAFPAPEPLDLPGA